MTFPTAAWLRAQHTTWGEDTRLLVNLDFIFNEPRWCFPWTSMGLPMILEVASVESFLDVKPKREYSTERRRGFLGTPAPCTIQVRGFWWTSKTLSRTACQLTSRPYAALGEIHLHSLFQVFQGIHFLPDRTFELWTHRANVCFSKVLGIKQSMELRHNILFSIFKNFLH